MHWRQKFDVVRAELSENEQLWSTFDLHEGAAETFVAALKAAFPFVGDEYVEFLRYTDGCRIYTEFLLGSGASHFVPDFIEDKNFFQCPALFEEAANLEVSLREWRNVDEIGEFMPVAMSTTREEYYLMLASGEILCVDTEEKETAHDNYVGKSFGEFLNEYMMGPKQPLLLYDHIDEWKPDMENELTQYLHKQGWWPEETGS